VVEFPRDGLLVTLLIAYGADVSTPPATWPWVDYTTGANGWEVSVPVPVTEGRSEGGSQLETSTCTFTLKNPSGVHTPDDDLGVVEGTPVWWQVDAGHGQVDYFAGYISSLLPEWPGRTRHGAVVRVACTGILGVLQTGTPPDLTPVQRAVNALAPAFHWPLNDGQDATQAGSGLDRGRPMVPGQLRPSFGAVSDPVLAGAPGSYVQVVTDGAYVGSLRAPLSGLPAAGWSVQVWTFVESVPPAEMDGFESAHVLKIDCAGSLGRIRISHEVDTDGVQGITLWVHRDDPSFPAFPGFGGVLDGPFPRWVHSRVRVRQATASTIEILHDIDGRVDTTPQVCGSGGDPLTLGPPIEAIVGADAEQPDGFDSVHGIVRAGVAQLVIAGDPDAAYLYPAGTGHAGELASDRIERVAAEERIPVDIVPGDSEPMGPQQPGTPAAIVLECEATDGGRLSEHAFGFRYRPRTALYNQTAGYLVDAAAGELGDPFKPTRDKSVIRNEWTVSRPSGSSATYADREHQKRARLPDSATINPATDDRLMQHAAWRTARTTTPGMRVSAVTANLGKHPNLVRGWQGLQLGDLVQVLHVRTVLPQHPPGDMAMLYEGRTHVLNGLRDWTGTLFTSPAQPMTVGLLDDMWLGRLAGDAELVAALPAGQLGAVSVQLNDATLWTTNPAHFPMLIKVRGEFIRLSSISGGSSPQSFVITERAVNGIRRDHPAGAPVRVVDAFRPVP